MGVFAGLADIREQQRSEVTPTEIVGDTDGTTTSGDTAGDTGGEDMPDGPSTHLGGTARLIAGARLPMRPPPRLRMPDAHLALDPWATTDSGHTYPLLRRTPPEIVIT